MLANRIFGGGFRRNTRQNIAVSFQVVNRVQQLLLSTFQIREYLGALIEKIVQQFGGHDRIVGCMVAPIGDHNIRQHQMCIRDSSGGPLFDPDSGEVLGVVNMVFIKGTRESALSNPSGISYAIPAKFVLQLLQRQVTN